MVVNPGYALVGIASLFIMCMGAGCISQAQTESVNSTVNISLEPVPVIITNASQPLVKNELLSYTETDEEWMYRNNGKKLGQNYEIIRGNVSGLKNMHVDIKVYRYKFLPFFRESGANSWGTNFWWNHIPDPDKKFLFVFLKSEMVGDTPNSDPRLWGFDSSNFAVQYKGQLIREDLGHEKCVAIKEMEYEYNDNDDSRVSDYGMIRINNAMYPGKGIICSPIDFLQMGKSNAWDGYLIYQVDKEATAKDLIVTGGFASFGNAWWQLE